MFDHAEGTEINWKEGKNLSVRVETRKQRHKTSNKTRIVKKTVACETFFNFFAPPAIPEDDEEDIDEDLDKKLEEDYEIGEFFKEELIPRAVDWFTGKAAMELADDVSPCLNRISFSNCNSTMTLKKKKKNMKRARKARKIAMKTKTATWMSRELQIQLSKSQNANSNDCNKQALISENH